jgi:hypothetical protein
MSFYENLADNVALKLVTQFGQAVTIRTKVTEDYDLGSGDVTTVETVETGVGVLLPGSNPQVVVDQDPARVNDTAVWVLAASGLTVAPVPGSVIDGDGASWAVIGMTPSSPAGVPIVYKALAKKTRVA